MISGPAGWTGVQFFHRHFVGNDRLELIIACLVKIIQGPGLDFDRTPLGHPTAYPGATGRLRPSPGQTILRFVTRMPGRTRTGLAK